MDKIINIEAIGYIQTEYLTREGTPSQGINSINSYGSIVIKDKFIEGIQGLKSGDLITIIFNFHKSTGYKLTLIPRKRNTPTGVFCTRSPDRPNGLGITVVEITKIEGRNIEFIGADMLNGTPVIDIKPYVNKP